MKNDKPPDKQAENRREGGRFAQGNSFGKKFEPGKSGNIAGRPRVSLFADELRRQVAQLSQDEAKTMIEAVVTALITKAISGDVKAIDMIADRLDGKPQQYVENTTAVPNWRKTLAENGFTEDDLRNEIEAILSESEADDDGTAH